jgi:hypothetical protein
MDYQDYLNTLLECKSHLDEYEILSKEFNRMNIEYRKYLIELGQLNNKFVLHKEKKIDENFFKDIFESFIIKYELNDYLSLYQNYGYLKSMVDVLMDENQLSFINRLKRSNEVLDNLIFTPNDSSNDELNCGIILTSDELNEIMNDYEEDLELEII